MSPTAAELRPNPTHFTGAKDAKRGFAGDGRKLVAGVADPGPGILAGCALRWSAVCWLRALL